MTKLKKVATVVDQAAAIGLHLITTSMSNTLENKSFVVDQTTLSSQIGKRACVHKFLFSVSSPGWSLNNLVSTYLDSNSSSTFVCVTGLKKWHIFYFKPLISVCSLLEIHVTIKNLDF